MANRSEYSCFIVLAILVLLSGLVNATVIDGFHDGDFTANPAWEPHSASGVWSAASLKLVSPNADSNINTPKNFHSLAQFTFSFYGRVNTAGNTTVWFNSPAKTPTGYNVILIGASNLIRLRYDTNVIISTGTAVPNVDFNLSVVRLIDGNFNLYVNGSSVGSAFNSQATLGSGFVVAEYAASGAGTGTFDDFNYLQDSLVIDVNAPLDLTTYTIRYRPFRYRIYDGNVLGCTSFNLDINNIVGSDNNLLVRHSAISSTAIDANYYLLNLEGSQSLIYTGRCVTDSDLSAQLTRSLILDLNAPRIYLFDHNLNIGWAQDANMNIRLGCTDTVSSTLNYFLRLNDVNIFDSNLAKDTNQTINSNPTDGDQNISFTCTDGVGRIASDQNISTIYAKRFFLINENTGAAFDLALVNGLTGRDYDTNTSYDFKANNDNNQSFISRKDNTIRFDINYLDNTTKIYREINFKTVGDENSIRVCVAPLQNFFVIDLISGKEKAVQMYNWSSTCYSLADKTKYASDGSLALKAYAIVASYYLYTVDLTTGARTVLSLIDGSKVESINLDLLEFNKQDLGFKFITEDVGFQRTSAKMIQIYYKNERANNSIIDFNIFDGATQRFYQRETASPNELTVNFDYSTITLDANKLHLVITATRNDGTIDQIDYYFTPGQIPLKSQVQDYFAIFMAVVLVIVGLTMLSVRWAFSWFGILIMIVGIAILGLASTAWYVTLLQGVFIFIAVVLAIASREQGSLVN